MSASLVDEETGLDSISVELKIESARVSETKGDLGAEAPTPSEILGYGQKVLMSYIEKAEKKVKGKVFFQSQISVDG